MVVLRLPRTTLICSRVAYNAIKAADPNMIVVAGAPTPTATNKIDVAVDDIIYFRQMFAIPKFWEKMDVVGAHFAGTLQPPDALPGRGARPEGWNGNSEFFFRRAEDLRAAMVDNRTWRSPGLDHRDGLGDQEQHARL